MPNYRHPYHKRALWLHWSEDGINFAPIMASEDVFIFGSLYVPHDPLAGETQTEGFASEYWGFESVKPDDRDWDLARVELKIR